MTTNRHTILNDLARFGVSVLGRVRTAARFSALNVMVRKCGLYTNRATIFRKRRYVARNHKRPPPRIGNMVSGCDQDCSHPRITAVTAVSNKFKLSKQGAKSL
jgi:hypothetical protein